MLGKKVGTRLRPLVQLLPAVVVAAVVLITLPATAPVLAQVPERLTAAAAVEAGQPQPEPPAETEVEEEPKLPYADGVYTGSSRGYGGAVQVQVTIADGRITDLQILNASHETSAFLRRARRLLKTVLGEQTWEVDAVSEATYTSRGILGAIRNALTGEVVINPLPPQPKPAAPLVVETVELPSAYRDGVYTASAQGFGGLITVQVTVAHDTIEDIAILDHAGETSSYFAKGRRVVSAILESGTPAGVDAVSGATYSSTGILNAVRLALAKAANEPEPAEELPASTEEAASSVPEETPEVMAPSVEVVHAGDTRPSVREWLTDWWETLFPAAAGEAFSAASSAAGSSPEDPAAPEESPEAEGSSAPAADAAGETAASETEPGTAGEQEGTAA